MTPNIDIGFMPTYIIIQYVSVCIVEPWDWKSCGLSLHIFLSVYKYIRSIYVFTCRYTLIETDKIITAGKLIINNQLTIDINKEMHKIRQTVNKL